MQEMNLIPERWFSVKETCAYLGVTRDTLLAWINEKDMPAHKVDRDFLRALPVLMALKDISPKGEVGVVAIDGRAASGKTTLSGLLSAALGAPVVHTDDFFLPPELRSPERLAEVGGNIDHERFCSEVLPNVNKKEGFSYGVFDCGVMRISQHREVAAAKWRIVEGSYSHHPKFGAYADLKVFCTVSPEEQMKRILARNGERMAERFKNEWIPMEERYFDVFEICQGADISV